MRIGIDLGGTKTEVIALDDAGEQRFRHRLPTPREDYQQTIETIGYAGRHGGTGDRPDR
ncbi:fructokinase [Salmonella enterica subsp. enterica]|nr:fructokinase [Salmonella enterica subsp. enterica]